MTTKNERRGEFSVHVPDLEAGSLRIQAPIRVAWLDEILGDTEVRGVALDDSTVDSNAVDSSARDQGGAEPTSGHVDLSIDRTGRNVIVRGRIDVTVTVPCARTLDPAIYRLVPDVFLLLEPSHRPSNKTARGSRSGSSHGDPIRPEKKTGPKKAGRGDSGGDSRSGWDADPVLSDEDAAADTYSGDDIILDDFLREFVLLEVPMVPLRQDLRDGAFEATPPLPQGTPEGESGSLAQKERETDPRFAALAELKAKLEKKE